MLYNIIGMGREVQIKSNTRQEPLQVCQVHQATLNFRGDS